MSFLESLWIYLLSAAPFLMLGLFISGIVHVFISTERIKKSLGGKGISGIVKSSLFGIPLPLCSCAVIPTAATLKKNGASNSATSAFLISTPESGVDSIAMTYGMMDLPMTIIRPIAAFFSAFFAGILQLFFNNEDIEIEEEKKSCCKKSAKSGETNEESFMSKAKRSLRFSFVDLIDDFAFWLALGIVFGALINFIVPENFFDGLDGFLGRVIILAIGVPLYICASATTPVAASLVMKGMSPGMALIILLVGPATNISNMLVIGKYIGKKGVLINVFAIVFVALLMSFITDFIYTKFSLPINFKVAAHHHEHVSYFTIGLTIAFILLLLKSLIFVEAPKFYKKLSQSRAN